MIKSQQFSVLKHCKLSKRVSKSQITKSFWMGCSSTTQTWKIATKLKSNSFPKSRWFSKTPCQPTKTLPLAVVTRTCKQRPMNTTEFLFIFKTQVQSSDHSSRSSSTGKKTSNQVLICLKTGRGSSGLYKLPNEAHTSDIDIKVYHPNMACIGFGSFADLDTQISELNWR